jgi:hypothetical protein
LLLATGAFYEHREIQGQEGKENLLYLKNYYDSVKLRKLLENTK